MKPKRVHTKIAKIHKVLGSSFRITLLYAIGKDEACVCHLENVLDKRQAYISQHLMALRDVGLLETRREGKYIYYRVAQKELFDLLDWSAQIGGLDHNQLTELSKKHEPVNCVCPMCQKNILEEKLESTEEV